MGICFGWKVLGDEAERPWKGEVMSVGTPVAKDDWAAPATRGELRLLDRKIDRVAVDLEDKIKDVARDLQIGMANIQTSIGRTIWIAAGSLGALGILLRFL